VKRLFSILAVIAGAAACGSEKSPPSEGLYTITFPSTAAAVSTDLVQVYVFDIPDGGAATLCPNLIGLRRTNQPLPPRLVEIPPTTPCDLAAGRQQLTIPYGVRAILAVGQRGGQDYLIGCALESVGDGNAPVEVVLTTFSSAIAIPPTSCRELSQKCQRKC
jgi:hypothetical protein